jgi:hypothetical protein
MGKFRGHAGFYNRFFLPLFFGSLARALACVSEGERAGAELSLFLKNRSSI